MTQTCWMKLFEYNKKSALEIHNFSSGPILNTFTNQKHIFQHHYVVQNASLTRKIQHPVNSGYFIPEIYLKVWERIICLRKS